MGLAGPIRAPEPARDADTSSFSIEPGIERLVFISLWPTEFRAKAQFGGSVNKFDAPVMAERLEVWLQSFGEI